VTVVDIIAIVSGGMDSSVMVHKLLGNYYEVDMLSFNYGQRHKKELDFAKEQAERLGLRHDIIDLWSSGITDLLAESESSLVSEADVPEGHYAQDNMKQTVVPNRNMMMLSIAGAVAVARGARYVATGVHAGDHFIYPDCRSAFIDIASLALWQGNVGFGNLAPSPIMAPFIKMTKADIAYMGIQTGVDFSQTWSCYKGGDVHCGRCGTCVERLEAIDEAWTRLRENYTDYENNPDTTEYADKNFWKHAVAEASK
jgi:7-cyano-7-deazaguanine synthase